MEYVITPGALTLEISSFFEKEHHLNQSAVYFWASTTCKFSEVVDVPISIHL